MKKFVSFALMLALVFTCAVSTVSADTAETTVFEPSYDIDNWSIRNWQNTEVDKTTQTVFEFNSTDKKVNLKYGQNDSAVYTPGVMRGDFIFTADIANTMTGSNYVIMNLAGVKFSFRGDGKVAVENGEYSENKYKNTESLFKVTIVYKSEGDVELYCVDPTTGKRDLVKHLSGDKYANKNADGKFSIMNGYTTGSVSNIKMYKLETYLNTFDGENPLSDFEVVGGNFVVKDFKIDDSTTTKVLACSEASTDFKWGKNNHFAWLNKYTAGSFSMSFDYLNSTADNRREFIFNCMNNSEAYAFVIIEKEGIIKLVKGSISDNELKNTIDLATATLSEVNSILGEEMSSLKGLSKIRIDYNAEQGGIYVYLNGKSNPVLSVVDNEHKNKMGRFGIWLWWQQSWGGTNIDNLKIEPSLPGFNVSVPTVTINTETNTVTGSAKVTNTTGSAKDAVVILAIYDKDKNLVEVKTAALANTMTACRDFELKAECTSWGDGKTAKCFVFDSLDTVAPLTNAVSYPEN